MNRIRSIIFPLLGLAVTLLLLVGCYMPAAPDVTPNALSAGDGGGWYGDDRCPGCRDESDDDGSGGQPPACDGDPDAPSSHS
jgi:hypothetical protein